MALCLDGGDRAEAVRGAAAAQRAADGRHARRRAPRHLGVGRQQPHAIWSGELYRIYGLTPETYTPSYEKYLTADPPRRSTARDRRDQPRLPGARPVLARRADLPPRRLDALPAHLGVSGPATTSGKLRALVGVCQDITDRKLAEEEVRDAERRSRAARRRADAAARESLRDLETFNAMVSHDLRAPLGDHPDGFRCCSPPRIAPLARRREELRHDHRADVADDGAGRRSARVCAHRQRATASARRRPVGDGARAGRRSPAGAPSARSP